jgi:hypothetical protein
VDSTARNRAIAAFRDGRLLWLWNFNVLLEGFDAPTASIIAIARPTRIRSLYAQMIGRGTRPHPSVLRFLDAPVYDENGSNGRREAIAASPKPCVRVLDYTGISAYLKLCWAGAIMAGRYDEEVVLMARQRILGEGGAVDIEEALEEAERVRDDADAHRAWMESQHMHVKAKAMWTGEEVDPFDVFGIGRFAHRQDSRRPTFKLIRFLTRMGVPTSAETTFEEARRLIVTVRNRMDRGLCTFKQAAVLREYGHPTDVSKEQATQIIDGIAAAGWPRPERMD